ncbi:MAG: NADH-quinone oxidoreductase subunit J [Methanosarcinaceae archaeon]|nr:NADH-quinone oxidoreductase subunit J [Methanosarcinaceae archaeon]
MVGIVELITFALVSMLTIGFSILVVTARDIVRAALSLVATLVSVAGVYVLLNAQFIGIVQVLVYVGGIGVLILFAVMLTTQELKGDSDVE